MIQKEAKKECKESSDMVQGTDKERNLCKRMDPGMSIKGKERNGAAAYIQTFLRALAARIFREGCMFQRHYRESM